MVALFLFLKGMTGALAPFSYLVVNSCNAHVLLVINLICSGQQVISYIWGRE
jgi:hypothetical protein